MAERKQRETADGGEVKGVETDVAAEGAAAASAQGGPSPAGDAPRRRPRRRSKAPRVAEVLPAEAAVAPAENATVSSARAPRGTAGGKPDLAVDAADADAEQGEVSDDEAPQKRRRRGARGGRRVRAREARRAAALAAGAPEGAAGETPDGVSDERPRPAVTAAASEAPAEPVVPPSQDGAEKASPTTKRRGRRGGRRKAGSTEAHAAAPDAAPAGTQPGSAAGDEQPPAETTGERPPVGTGEAMPAGDVAGAAAQEKDAAPGPKRRRRAKQKRVAGQGETEAATEPLVAPDEAAPAPDASVAEEKYATASADEGKGARKGRKRDRRRPKAIVRSENLMGADAGAIEGPALSTGRRPDVSVELPKRKLILATQDPNELRVALVEDGRLAEIYFERPEKRSYLGDIYRGKVENVLGGIDAAFIDFGLDKNGFLYVDEVRTGEGDRRGRRIGDVLKPGQDVVVQVMKDPMGHKGARLTMHISLAGRYVVYVPGGSGVGVSRRLGQAERERLRELCRQLRVKNAGLIVRTAAEGEGLEAIRRDVRFLSRLWSRLKKKAETAPIPGLIHQEVDIALEVTRDLFNESVESLIVDDEKRHKAIVQFLDKVAPELVPRVRIHTGAEPLFEAYGIEQQISRALERRVPLPSGGNIVIDHAEALTVIDVNSGRYTSGRGLEDTILKTNLEAAREVVRQLRLRDIGGIIIIDFIDMARVKNRETVLATLEAELDTDRTKTYVVELSPLGLVEMTRQNTTDGARGILTRTCQTCQGKARTLSEETVALGVERRLRIHARRSGAKAFLVEVNAGVAERLSASGRLKALEKETGRRIFVEGSSTVPVDAFRMLAEGSLDNVQSQRIPVREGQEIELELEFALTYSPRDAVGYVDGYMVIVEGGRGFLGQRRKVLINAAARTGASAVLTGGKGV